MGEGEKEVRRRRRFDGSVMTLIAGGLAVAVVLVIVVVFQLVTEPGEPSTADGTSQVPSDLRLADLRLEFARTIALAIERLGWASGVGEAGRAAAVEGEELRRLADEDRLTPEAALPAVALHRNMLEFNRIGAEGRRFSVRLLSDAGQPGDEIEAEALELLVRRAAETELVRLDRSAGTLRYFRPLRMRQSCAACHGTAEEALAFWGDGAVPARDVAPLDGWTVGETAAAIEVIQFIFEH